MIPLLHSDHPQCRWFEQKPTREGDVWSLCVWVSVVSVHREVTLGCSVETHDGMVFYYSICFVIEFSKYNRKMWRIHHRHHHLSLDFGIRRSVGLDDTKSKLEPVFRGRNKVFQK